MDAASLNPTSLTAAQLAMVLSKAGGKVTAQQIEQDLAAGAPRNSDGTLHLVHYTAWLAGQVR
jgi:hypothetical protein